MKRDDNSKTTAPAVVLGLGNPGRRFVATRHNVGFRVLDELARRREVALDHQECGALIGEGSELLLVAPQIYMNRSGFTARCLVERRGVTPERILVVYDELRLPLGKLRLRRAGSPGGHRGMESVAENLGSDQVPRLRLGVGSLDGDPDGGEAQVDFVLSPFAKEQFEAVEKMICRAADACETWLSDGIEVAMQRFNG